MPFAVQLKRYIFDNHRHALHILLPDGGHARYHASALMPALPQVFQHRPKVIIFGTWVLGPQVPST